MRTAKFTAWHEDQERNEEKEEEELEEAWQTG